jgi:putative glutamine amidotransferase
MRYRFVLFLFILCYISCKQEIKETAGTIEEPPLILVSKDFSNIYRNWLSACTKKDNFTCYNMYILKNKDSLNLLLEQADGIIISGGEDVNPCIYGKNEDISRCGSIDNRRDSLEQEMILYAIEHKIPLLGVCRGCQIINVTEDGTLIIDIPKDIGTLYLHRDLRKEDENMNTRTYHTVYAEKNSLLYRIVQADSGDVHSNHHQSVDKIAPGYKVSSFSKDRVVESIELSDTLLHPFILAVQWHPEAMDIRNPYSGKIGKAFMQKVIQHKKSRHNQNQDNFQN